MAEIWLARSRNVKKQQKAKGRMKSGGASHDVFVSTTTTSPAMLPQLCMERLLRLGSHRKPDFD